ncbi:MAG: GNAT family N-acetyltransferase [Zavarzinia sp.]|nr:GNAT family N-acetyltransferase [Zavarzinia sp.]
MFKSKTDDAIRPVTPDDRAEWLRLRGLLWPDESNAHAAEIDGFLAAPAPGAQVLVLETAPGRLGGFIELAERAFAEGCATSPVAYVEGVFVEKGLRRRGAARRLVDAAVIWARDAGYHELGSDAYSDNRTGRRLHLDAGFEEVAHITCFRLPL